MCKLDISIIDKITKNQAVFKDGRKALTAGIKNLKKGDRVKVYANLIIERYE